jgi:broad specificity phosphatase PhoE
MRRVKRRVRRPVRKSLAPRPEWKAHPLDNRVSMTGESLERFEQRVQAWLRARVRRREAGEDV